MATRYPQIGGWIITRSFPRINWQCRIHKKRFWASGRPPDVPSYWKVDPSFGVGWILILREISMINSWKTETHRPATINPSFKQNFGWLNWWNHVKSCEKSFVVRVQQPMVSCFFLGGDLSCAMEKHPTHPAILMLEAGAGSLCRLMKIFLSRPGGSWVWRPDAPGKFHQNDGDFTYGEMAISSWKRWGF